MNEQPQKKSLWERTKIAVKSFTSNAIGYIPRGIAFSGAMFAGSSLLESQFGVGLGVNGWSSEVLLNRGMATVALGSILSGTMAATSDVHCACKENSAAKENNNPMINQEEQKMGQEILRQVTGEGIVKDVTNKVFEGSGLPPSVRNASKHLGIG